MGKFSRGRRNSNGQQLVEFCECNDFVITNTLFDHRASHRTTWAGSRRDRETGEVLPIYNQIDYILVKARQRPRVTNARSYAGTVTNSDHRLVAMEIRVKANKHATHVNTSRPVKFNITTLALDSTERDKYRETLNTKLASMSEHPHWNELSKAILDTAEETVGILPNNNNKYRSNTIAQLSTEQKELRLRINNTRSRATREKLKKERNALLHEIQAEARRLQARELEAKLKEIEEAKDSAKMFKATRMLTRTSKSSITVIKDGETINKPEDIAEEVAKYFNVKLNNDNIDSNKNGTAENNDDCVDIINNNVISNNETLSKPITADEVATAARAIKNGRAPGPDNIPGELFKYGSNELFVCISDLLNRAFSENSELGLGEGTLIPLAKPGKPKGLLSSLRPIVLLTTLRKTLSTVILNRIRDKVEKFLSPTQSGFRQNRSTSDAVWAHKWIIATTQKHRIAIENLGLDMTSAFDTLDRQRLLNETRSIFDDDEWRMIKKLLDTTTLRVRVCNALSLPFDSTWGSPQGDSASPIIFTIYLELALRQLRHQCIRPKEAIRTPPEISYADDVDFISTSSQYIQTVMNEAPTVLKDWNLKVNEAKLEHTIIKRDDRDKEAWRSTKKLGSLLGDHEDLKRRKQLAANAFSKSKALWPNTSGVSLTKRLRIYNACVKPVLTYNMSTWALTQAESNELDAFHRRQLRSIIGVRYPDTISNNELYARTKTTPLSLEMFLARWKLFGHTLRMNNEVPAKQAMLDYFSIEKSGETSAFQGRPRTTPPIVLSQDLEQMKAAAAEARANATNKQRKTAAQQLANLYAKIPNQLRSLKDLQQLEQLARTRKEWIQLVNDAHALQLQQWKSQREKAK
jgi:hypothetical protein